MVEKTHSPMKSKGPNGHDVLNGKNLDGSLAQSQVKLLDGNYTEKERRQVVMKLIQFMKAG